MTSLLVRPSALFRAGWQLTNASYLVPSADKSPRGPSGSDGWERKRKKETGRERPWDQTASQNSCFLGIELLGEQAVGRCFGSWKVARRAYGLRRSRMCNPRAHMSETQFPAKTDKQAHGWVNSQGDSAKSAHAHRPSAFADMWRAWLFDADRRANR